MPKVAYHLADVDKVGFVIGNIENHIAGMGGPDKVTIVLVVHGPALALFRRSKANPDLARRLSGIADGRRRARRLRQHARGAEASTSPTCCRASCAVDEGGVVRLARLQAEGYAYLRP